MENEARNYSSEANRDTHVRFEFSGSCFKMCKHIPFPQVIKREDTNHDVLSALVCCS